MLHNLYEVKEVQSFLHGTRETRTAAIQIDTFAITKSCSSCKDQDPCAVQAHNRFTAWHIRLWKPTGMTTNC